MGCPGAGGTKRHHSDSCGARPFRRAPVFTMRALLILLLTVPCPANEWRVATEPPPTHRYWVELRDPVKPPKHGFRYHWVAIRARDPIIYRDRDGSHRVISHPCTIHARTVYHAAKLWDVKVTPRTTKISRVDP